MKRTNLFKICPRCGRKGEIFVDAMPDEVTVVWEGAPRGLPERQDRTTGLSFEELLDSNFGCGYDSPEPKAR